MTYDLSISGSWGLYTIATPTQRGKDWAALHLSEDTGERTRDEQGNVVCEGGERCRDIVSGAVADGLNVEVNGTNMAGYGQPQKKKTKTRNKRSARAHKGS